MKYKRILLKLSGESLAGAADMAWIRSVSTHTRDRSREMADAGVEIGIVIGGGNIFPWPLGCVQRFLTESRG